MMQSQEPIQNAMSMRYGLIVVMVGVSALLADQAAYGQIPPRPKDSGDSSKPSLFVAERLIELGSIVEGDVPSVSWTLENRGGSVLEIERTTTSCGCTVVSLTEEQKRIEPGASLTLTAQFDSRGRRGASTKEVTVISNDPAEPQLKLQFHVVVEPLYNINPPGIINLRMVRRGDDTQQTVDFLPAEGRKKLEILRIETDDDALLRFKLEPLESGEGRGQRIRFSVAEDIPLGTLRARANVHFTVDGIAREHGVVIRGEVVGDLVWRPTVVDMTRHAITPGRTFPPVVIESTARAPIKILDAQAGPLFDVSIDRSKPERQSVTLALRPDAPAGPFGVMLEVRTGSPDQPVVAVPVFGLVAPKVEVEPPVILLQDNGTRVGTHRRIIVRAGDPSQSIRPAQVTCDHPGVRATLNDDAPVKHKHMFSLDVVLSGKASDGSDKATLIIQTDNPEIGDIRVPVIIQS